MRTKPIAAVAVLMGALGARAAQADSLNDLADARVSLKVVNNSQYLIRNLYMSPTYSDDWGRDAFREHVLSPGSTGVSRPGIASDLRAIRPLANDETIRAPTTAPWILSLSIPPMMRMLQSCEHGRPLLIQWRRHIAQ
jgi:hypothetical protein